MRTERFTFVCSLEERQVLRTLSNHLYRSQGDTIRFLMKEATMKFGISPPRNPTLINRKEKT